jgi:hypothetical protein
MTGSIMHKRYTCFLLFLVASFGQAVAQETARTVSVKCGTMQRLEQRLQQSAELKVRFQQQQESFTRLLSARTDSEQAFLRTGEVTTIPVVFHIVTDDPSLVTDVQVQAQLDTLNMDFSGTNGDSVRIPSYFKSLFGKSAIQFCLAQRTPDGEPTSGIIRKAGTGSFTTDDKVKHAATGGSDAWNPAKYFNIWVTPLSGDILGYSTFPGDGSASEQGIVIDYRSLPGGSYTQYNGGKTLTHEAGHFFNLYHIWGDDNGGCTGSDFVGDTPGQADATNGCTTGIKTDNCTPGGNGIMYQNYMDYSYDQCLVMFTTQQVSRMEAALLQFRASLLSSDGCQPVVLHNVDAQLRAITSPVQRLCAPGFTPAITVRNKGSQTITNLLLTTTLDGQVIETMTWTGIITTSSEQAIVLKPVTITPGLHALSITVSQVNGRNDENVTNNTLVQPVQYFAPALTVSESFEGAALPPAAWDIVNPDGGITWQRVTGISKTGSASVMINNFDDDVTGEKDDLRLPTVQFSSALDSAFLSFQLAAATYTATNTQNNIWDTLEVLVSTDCGQTYSSLYKKWGASLVTRTAATEKTFVPTATEWRKDSIDVSSYIGKGDLLFAFRNTNGYENNIYLDDIHLRTVTINPNLKESGFLVTPNPARSTITVQFYPQPANLTAVQVFTTTGQKIAEQIIGTGTASNHYTFNLSAFPAGTYYVRVVYTDRVHTKKIVKY